MRNAYKQAFGNIETGDSGALRTGGNTRVHCSDFIVGGPGTAAKPSLSFAKDANTGLLHPATSNIGFSTGGVERMRLNAAGFLGIGTTLPTSPLTVSGMIHCTSGGFKFPDGTVQTTAASVAPDSKNISDGIAFTDLKGRAVVTIPSHFSALNRDFRYQLTPIGQFAQAIVAAELNNNQFVIQTDRPNVKVSWQVTGTPQDACANAHRIPAEERRNAEERVFDLHPKVTVISRTAR
jgi:hypothetical protein